MNDRAPARRRPGAGFAAVALGAIVVLVGLGTWQVERLTWKRGQIAERKAMLARPPMPVAGAAAFGAVAGFQPVVLTGVFMHNAEMLVGPRARDGAPGWRVITPLDLPRGGIVLVDRGWVPAGRKAPERRQAGQVTGRVTVQGIARFPGPRGWFTPENEPAKGQWFRVSPHEMAAARGLAGVAGWWLAADAAANPGGWPRGGEPAPMPPDNHLQYAITWYALALAAAVIAGMLWVRGRRPPAPR